MSTDEPGAAPGDPRGSLVRPYAVTGGRTRPEREIAIEALVRATPEGRRAADRLRRDQRRIVLLCGSGVRSLAELAAHLERPVGVVRVLLDDLAADGLVRIDHAAAPSDGEVGVPLLEKVLAGLQAL